MVRGDTVWLVFKYYLSFCAVQKSRGLRIAMTIYTEQEATVENSRAYRKDMLANTLHALYGYAENYNVYSGEILHVEDSHLEHNINCFQGCAGAVIFLLEGNHAGKAMAVHVGSPEGQEANLAFKIHQGLKYPVFSGAPA